MLLALLRARFENLGLISGVIQILKFAAMVIIGHVIVLDGWCCIAIDLQGLHGHLAQTLDDWAQK